jgi:hypothetical protein
VNASLYPFAAVACLPTLYVQYGGNLRETRPRTTTRLSTQSADAFQRLSFIVKVAERFRAVATPGLMFHPLTRGPQFSDDHRFVELRDGPQNLANQNTSRVAIRDCQVRPVRADHGDAERPKAIEDCLLNHQITGESSGIFNDHYPDAVVPNAFQKR